MKNKDLRVWKRRIVQSLEFDQKLIINFAEGENKREGDARRLRFYTSQSRKIEIRRRKGTCLIDISILAEERSLKLNNLDGASIPPVSRSSHQFLSIFPPHEDNRRRQIIIFELGGKKWKNAKKERDSTDIKRNDWKKILLQFHPLNWHKFEEKFRY